jgi:hypothetical protein
VKERWAETIIPVGWEETGKVVEVDGRTYCGTTYILKPDDLERVRLGYACISCLDPHPVPYPLRCGVCGFPMARFQDQVFAALYEGEVRVGPQTSLSDEWEIAKEEVRRGNRSDA